MEIEEISRRVVEKLTALANGLAGRGWKIATPEPFRSGILAATPPDGNAVRVAKGFEAGGIIVAPREGAVRFSPHANNDPGEAERILEAVDGIGRG